MGFVLPAFPTQFTTHFPVFFHLLESNFCDHLIVLDGHRKIGARFCCCVKHCCTVLERTKAQKMAEAPEQGNSRLSQAQAQVGEVVDIMRVNVEKVLERDSKLSELDQRADNLQEGANQFQTQVNFSLTPFDTIYGMYSQFNVAELFVVELVFIAS